MGASGVKLRVEKDHSFRENKELKGKLKQALELCNQLYESGNWWKERKSGESADLDELHTATNPAKDHAENGDNHRQVTDLMHMGSLALNDTSTGTASYGTTGG